MYALICCFHVLGIVLPTSREPVFAVEVHPTCVGVSS